MRLNSSEKNTQQEVKGMRNLSSTNEEPFVQESEDEDKVGSRGKNANIVPLITHPPHRKENDKNIEDDQFKKAVLEIFTSQRKIMVKNKTIINKFSQNVLGFIQNK